MTIEVQVGESVVEFPDGTPKGVMENALRSFAVAQTSAPPRNDSAPDVGRGSAALEGYLSGASANFRDEIYGASKASGLPDWMGGFRAPVGAARLAMDSLSDQPGEVTKTYEQARDEKRAFAKQAAEQFPGTT